MNCPWHPNKRAVSSCKECGTDFCIECVRETDQTTLCPDCYRRKLNEIAREFTEPDEAREKHAPAPFAADGRTPRPGPEISPFDEEEHPPAAVASGRSGKTGKDLGRGPAEMPAASPAEDFLSQGPDDDFSSLGAGSSRPRRRWGRKAREAPAQHQPPSRPATGEGTSAAREGETQAGAEHPPPEGPQPPAVRKSMPSEDRLLQDVMSTLLKPEADADVKAETLAGEMREAPAGSEAGAGAALRGSERARKEKAAEREERKAKRALAAMDATGGKKRMERWSFLAQPRSSQYTLIATSWWRAALFIVLMFLLGVVLWAVPNAYLVPKDQEYGIHAVLVGLVLGLAFWWKAGKKHSTKLAVQAALTTFFALFIGEFLHWFLIITKYKAFRTIFFDLVSFRFLWENGADILKYTMEAMFPIAFLWLLLLPTLTAFIVGFGMPPIPEIFFQVWHALRGRVPEEKEASHGLEG